MHTDVHDELRDQVAAVMSDRAGIEVPDAEADLLDAGLIDSLALVTLIVAFEDTFGVQLPLDDFDIDRFRSVASIADFLASLGAEPVRDGARRSVAVDGPRRRRRTRNRNRADDRRQPICSRLGLTRQLDSWVPGTDDARAHVSMPPEISAAPSSKVRWTPLAGRSGGCARPCLPGLAGSPSTPAGLLLQNLRRALLDTSTLLDLQGRGLTSTADERIPTSAHLHRS